MTQTNPPGTAAGSHASINGLDLYYEVHGRGHPLVLLHGGLMTIDLNFAPVLPALGRRHRVIAVELQGHGHTADTDREMTLADLAGDVAQLLAHLGIRSADVLGFSLGGAVALTLAITRPELVDRLVLASVTYRGEGSVDLQSPDESPGAVRMPTEADFQAIRDAYAAVAPDPDHFDAFAAKAVGLAQSLPDRDPADLRAIASPTLILVGDTDFVRLPHAVEMSELIPNGALAVLPATTHMGVFRRPDVVVPLLEGFLERGA